MVTHQFHFRLGNEYIKEKLLSLWWQLLSLHQPKIGEKKYGISTQSSKPLCVCVKSNTSFQLQLETSATFHIQKIFSIFLWTSKKLRLSDYQHKISVSLGWQILAKKCNIFKTTFKRWMYANLAFHIKFNIFSYIYKPIQMPFTGWQVHGLMLI